MAGRPRKHNAIDALLALGRVFGLRSAVYVDATNYVFQPYGKEKKMLEYEDMPSYENVLAHASNYLKTHKEEQDGRI